MRNGKHESNAPSRFLREIAPQYLQNPLRKEDFSVERSVDDDDHPGFRFGRFGGGGEISPRASLGRNDKGGSFGRNDRGGTFSRNDRIPPRGANSPVGTPRPTTREAVLNRPLPPKVPDAEFTPDPMSSFRVGDRIEHNRFGVGKVLKISGEVPDIKANIVFEKYGEKILLLKYAKIRHI
jgi:DNA helicase-2/ATP-dependent DNA helicase PcrA